MASEGSSKAEKTISFIIRLIVSILLPLWGLAIIMVGAVWGMGWWIATGLVVFAIGAVFLAGSPLLAPFLGGR